MFCIGTSLTIRIYLAFTIIMLIAIVPVTAFSNHNLKPNTVRQMINSQGKINLSFGFTQNKGQCPPEVAFTSRLENNNAFFTTKELVITPNSNPDGKDKSKSTVSLRWKGMNNTASIEGNDKSTGVCNYYIGNDPKKWQTGVPTYKTIRYNDLYPGIGLSFQIQDGMLRGDYIVSPYTDPLLIQLCYSGAKKIKLLKNGDIEIKAGKTKLTQKSPITYQIINGRKLIIASNYVIEKDKTIKFSLGAYDKSKELIIDPTLVYATFFGGSKQDFYNQFDMDPAGELIISGYTNSNDFPVRNSTRKDTLYHDVFVTKFGRNGELKYSTFIGGNNEDACEAMVVDSIGQVFIGGNTSSYDFPLVNQKYGISMPPPNYFPPGTAYLAKLDSNGSLLFSNIFNDTSVAIRGEISGLSLDGNGNIYALGLYTYKKNGNPFIYNVQILGDSTIYFIDKQYVKFSPSLDVVYFCLINYTLNITFFKSDASGNVFIGGEQKFTPTFPLVNSFQSNFGGGNTDAFIAKINSNASQIVYSTYLGGRGDDHLNFNVDRKGNAYATGLTTPPFIHTIVFKGDSILTNIDTTQRPYYTLVKLDPAGALKYSIGISDGIIDYQGRWDYDTYNSSSVVAVDKKEEPCAIFYPGMQHPLKNLPLVNPIQNSDDGTTAYMFKANSEGNKITFATYLPDGLLGYSGNTYFENYNFQIATNSTGRTIAVAGAVFDNANMPTTDSALIKKRSSLDNIWIGIISDTCSNLVTNTNDDGPGSLRDAINCANDYPGTRIQFALNPSDPNYSNGVYTIKIKSALPELTQDGTWIDGFSQTRISDSNPLGPEVQIMPDLGFKDYYAISIKALGCEISTLALNGFKQTDTSSAILIHGNVSRNNDISYCYIGIDPTDKRAVPNCYGIIIKERASQNNIFGDCISGQINAGILIDGSDSNTIHNSKIGCNNFGDDTIPNDEGVVLKNANYNVIGGEQLGNIISGNTTYGIRTASNANHNRIESNYIGVDFTGEVPLRNGTGIFISSSYNNIGGKKVSLRNIISGNRFNNIWIYSKYELSSKGSNNVIEGNYIGANKSGIKPVENSFNLFQVVGINIRSADSNTIGGTDTLSRNVISGNYTGIKLLLSGKSKISGNIIGLNADGTDSLSNFGNGIEILISSRDTIGGITKAERNIISGNFGNGVYISGDKSYKNRIMGNYIGTNLSGIAAIANHGSGVFIENAPNNFIGGLTESETNIISGNVDAGVMLTGPGAIENTISGNFIGTDLAAVVAIPNKNGIVLAEGASKTIVGNKEGFKNVISGNTNYGIFINGDSKSGNKYRTFDNIIYYNVIGADASKLNAIGNLNGIYLLKSAENSIGKNYIYNNRQSGLELLSSSNNNIYDNFIQNNKVGIKLTIQEGFAISEWNQISHNIIQYNETGIDDKVGIANVFANNIIRSNTGHTGIHLSGASPMITSNWISNDANEGIVCDSGSAPVIHKNVITNNQSYGAINNDSKINVNAQQNWWGSSNGPSGSGTGSGDKVSANIDFSNWLTDIPGIVISAPSDTIFIPEGSVYDAGIYLRNWKNFSDSIEVAISEMFNWIQGEKISGFQLKDSSGAGLDININAPASVSGMQVNKIKINAQSVLDNNASAQDSFYVAVYQPKLTSFIVTPDTALVNPGNEVSFSSFGFDDYQNPFNINSAWSATGGSIDSLGFYTAGSVLGTFNVTAKDSASGKESSSVVIITNNITAVDDNILKPSQFNQGVIISQNYPNPFSTSTTIKFEIPYNSNVSIKVYDILGNELGTILDKYLTTGTYSIDYGQQNTESGIYILKLTTDQESAVKMMLKVK